MDEINNEVVEVGTEVAEKVVEEVAIDEAVSNARLRLKKAGLITLGVGAVVAITGVVIKKRKDIKAWWNRIRNKQETDEFSDETEEIVDETED